MNYLKRLPIFSFQFWQKSGKALDMVSGLLAVQTIARIMEDLGWSVIGNLHILFAIAIGGSWAKERAGSALLLFLHSSL